MTHGNAPHCRSALLLTLSSCLLFLGGFGAAGTFGCNVGTSSGGVVSGTSTPGNPTSPSAAPSGAPVPKPKPEDGYGSSAPPISLPAPVTGRLTVTSPDANYDSLNIGDVEAVPANSMVMAVNDTQAAIVLESDWMTGFSIAALMDSLIPSAEADSPLPDICTQSYHACGLATVEGAFEFALTGRIGDNVSISIIDATTGDILSETTHRVIPPNIRALPRRVNHVAHLTDFKNKMGFLYSLMPTLGGGPKGLVEIRDLEAETSDLVPFDGPSPQRIELNAWNMKAGVIDTVGQFAAFVDLGLNNFNDLALSKILISNPTDVALSFDASRMVVTTKPSVLIGQMLKLVKTSGMTAVDTITDVELPGAIFPAGGKAVDTIAVEHGYFKTTKWLDVYAFVGMYLPIGSTAPPKPYVGIVSDDGADDYSIRSMLALPNGCLPKDIAFGPQDEVLVACGSINQIVRSQMSLSNADPVDVILTGFSVVNDPNNLVKEPLQIASDGRLDGKRLSAGSKNVFVAVKDGDELHPDSVLTLKASDGFAPSKRSDVGLRPTGIATPYDGTKVFISTGVSHSITILDFDDLM